MTSHFSFENFGHKREVACFKFKRFQWLKTIDFAFFIAYNIIKNARRIL